MPLPRHHEPEADHATDLPALDAGNFLTDAAKALAAHWLSLSGPLEIPRKSAIRPEMLKPVLPNILIYEYLAEDDIRIRLAGTGTYAAYRRELTGTNYLDLVPVESRRASSLRLHSIIHQPCALRTRLLGPAGRDIYGEYEVLGLPLAGPDGRPQFSIHSTSLIERGDRIDGQGSRPLLSASCRFLDIGYGLPSIADDPDICGLSQ